MKKRICLIVAIFLIVTYSRAQDTTHYTTKPKVGLVLSGGGAKGIAHIGVLKVLEEVGIKPDYITGTSMGSIMGGLYSIGYSAYELDSLVRVIDWNQMLSDKIPLSMVVPVEKHDYNRFLLTFPLELTGPKLPDGLISGQGIAEEMNHLTWRVAHLDSFDDYPIPFRCVSSDLISGKPHVFDSGSLSTAMRASMAIPSVFSPVRIDSMLLVDGGVLDNLPVGVCKDLGADIIISVNVGFEDKPKAEDFRTITDIMMGAAMISSSQEVDRSLAETDILITPSLTGYTAGSFTSGPEIIDLGEQGARRMIDELKELAVYLNQFPETDASADVQSNKKVEKLYISKIKLDSLQTLDKKFVYGKFGLEEDRSYSKKEINEGLHRLIGTRYIDNVDYSIAPLDSGYALTLKPAESNRSKLSVGIHYDNNHKAGATVSASFRNLLLQGSHFKTTVDISEYPRLATDFYDYIGVKQQYGIYGKLRWENTKVPVYYENGTEIGNFVNTFFDARAGMFLSPGTSGILSVGGFYRTNLVHFGKGLLDIISADLDKVGNRWWGLNLSYNKNTLDKQFMPNRGSYLNVNVDMPLDFAEVYKGPDSLKHEVAEIYYVPYNHYVKASLEYKRHLPLSKKFNWIVGGSAGWSSASLPFSDLSYVGGIRSITRTNDVSFYGLMPRELMTSQYLILSSDIRYNVLPSLYIHGVVNMLDSYNEPHISLYSDAGSLEGKVFLWGGGLKVSYESILGPIEVGYGISTLHNAARWYVAAGFPF
ncbi:patatin-like phospholipase family protein [Saccharicrinis aurantiacus]|uniref:patatin-like phospholipase family protein n=1 Tax=Saccharicrinis aurantiacus TaxID=1849719 RepID=UPI00094FD560|nr:patatin-like phospholipase family protein [Saccharicrinis aurantiacus]